MPKKVYELAKELGVSSKDLVDRAIKLGMDVKSHMSVLTDADCKRLSAKPERTAPRPQAAGQVPGRRGPVGRPIVNESYFENKRKPPVGKPIVDSDFLAAREKAKTEEKVADKKPAAPVKEPVKAHEEPKKEAPVKEAPKKEAPQEKAVKPEEPAVKAPEKTDMNAGSVKVAKAPETTENEEAKQL